MAFTSGGTATTAELCERAARACAESRKTLQEARDSLVTAKALAANLRRRNDAEDTAWFSLLIG